MLKRLLFIGYDFNKHMKKMNISSTYIREQLKLGNNVQDLVPEEIRAEVERIYK